MRGRRKNRNLKNSVLNRKKKFTATLKFIQDNNEMENDRLSIGTRQNVMVTKIKNTLKVLATTQTLSFEEDKPRSTFRK